MWLKQGAPYNLPYPEMASVIPMDVPWQRVFSSVNVKKMDTKSWCKRAGLRIIEGKSNLRAQMKVIGIGGPEPQRFDLDLNFPKVCIVSIQDI